MSSGEDAGPEGPGPPRRDGTGSEQPPSSVPPDPVDGPLPGDPVDGPVPGDPVDGPAPARGAVVDIGLQHERTGLAWDRTALALLVVGVLAVRSAVGRTSPLWLLPGLATVAVGALLLWLGGRHHRRREQDLHAGASPVRTMMVLLTGATAVGISLVALVLIVLSGR